MNDDVECISVVESMTDYLESALPPARRSRIDLHFAECPDCDPKRWLGSTCPCLSRRPADGRERRSVSQGRP